MKTQAFLFDLNGTMIDDMSFHAQAWHEILNGELSAALTRQQVEEQMYGKNSELLDRIFGVGTIDAGRAEVISMKKEQLYQAAFLPHLKLIAGLPAFLEKAKSKGILMAIGSAAIPFNIDFVLDNLGIRHYFGAVVSADDVRVSKPHPETFLKCASLLNVPPEACIVFEDAPKGVEAAGAAGMSSIVLTTMHNSTAFTAYSNIGAYVKDYLDPVLDQLFN